MDKELRFESELNSIVEKAFEKSYNLHYRFGYGKENQSIYDALRFDIITETKDAILKLFKQEMLRLIPKLKDRDYENYPQGFFEGRKSVIAELRNAINTEGE
jgi:hypothetical protein